MDLWNTETPIKALEALDPDNDYPQVPPWIDSEVTPSTVAAIIQGGCASGAYMPAVTYFDARETLNEHGDSVFHFIGDALGEIPQVPEDHRQCWDYLACYFLSMAVELWAQDAEATLDSIPEPEDGQQ